jgi:hypothetical protein
MDINNRFEITTDKHNWILRDWRLSEDGERSFSKKGRGNYAESFFSRPEQLFQNILNRSGKSANDIEELIEFISLVRDEILKATRDIKKEHI